MLVQLSFKKVARKRAFGFTLFELLITLAILAVLASLAVPSYRKFVINQQLSAASSDFLGSMLQARSEALKQGKIVAIFPTNGTDWTSGWYLSVVNSNCTSTGLAFGSTDAVGEFVSVKSSGTTKSFASTNPSFAYTPVGYPYISCAGSYYSGQMNGTLIFQATETAREKRVIVSMSGRARICDPLRETCSTD